MLTVTSLPAVRAIFFLHCKETCKYQRILRDSRRKVNVVFLELHTFDFGQCLNSGQGQGDDPCRLTFYKDDILPLFL